MAHSRVPYDGPIVSRDDALAAGVRQYFTGKPCVNGHLAQRNTSNYACMACATEMQDATRRQKGVPTKSEWMENTAKKRKEVKNSKRKAKVKPCLHCGKIMNPIESDSESQHSRILRKFCSDHCRLFSKVVIRGPDDCWLFRNPQSSRGYGMLSVGEDSMPKAKGAHTVSWELANGVEKPYGMCVCHTCDVPACVNPKHLFLGTKKDNNLDKVVKGRQPKGTEINCAKLTPDRVIAIRQDTRLHRVIAEDYGVARSVITAVKARRTWKHVP